MAEPPCDLTQSGGTVPGYGGRVHWGDTFMKRIALPAAMTAAAGTAAAILAGPDLDLALLVWAAMGLFGFLVGFAAVLEARTAHGSAARAGAEHAVVRPAATRTVPVLGAGLPQTVPQPAAR